MDNDDDEDEEKKDNQDEENQVVLLKLKAIEKNFGKLDKFRKLLTFRQKTQLKKYDLKFTNQVTYHSTREDFVQPYSKIQWKPSKQFKTTLSFSHNIRGLQSNININYKPHPLITTNFSLNNKIQGSAQLKYKSIYQNWTHTANIEATNKNGNPYKWGISFSRSFQHQLLFTEKIPLQFTKFEVKLKDWKAEAQLQNFNQMSNKLKFSEGIRVTTTDVNGILRIESPQSNHMWCAKFNKKYSQEEIGQQIMYLYNPQKYLKIGAYLDDKFKYQFIFENQIQKLNNLKLNLGINCQNLVLKMFTKFRKLATELSLQVKLKQLSIGFVAFKFNLNT